MAKSLPILDQAPQTSALRNDGRRNFVVPADVSGRFTRLRRIVFMVLIAVYVALPWIEINGHPAVFLDVEHRAFYLFGATFNAQDFWLSFFLVTGAGFSLIFVTALWGRVWCGYACPQTVFLDGVYRRVERWIEGPRNVRNKRDQGPWTPSRVLRKVGKHGAFALLSFVIAHVFLSYFVSLPALLEMMASGHPSQAPQAFAWAAGTTALLYFNFAWFREQLCIVICPYGRLQSVLTDQDSLVIGYDVKRGEPRGKSKAKAKLEGRGDCVDCMRCVVVCPTGIDIRNGLQLDCIGCAACVDACDEVMDKLERPRGLIRYDSHNGFSEQPKRVLRPRVYVYALLGALGLIVAFTSVRSREPFEANLLRLPGSAFVLEAEGQRVRNAFELHLVNKHAEPVTFRIAPAAGQDLEVVLALREFQLAPLKEKRLPVFASAPNDRKARELRLEVQDGQQTRVVKGAFVAPR